MITQVIIPNIVILKDKTLEDRSLLATFPTFRWFILKVLPHQVKQKEDNKISSDML